MSLILAASVSRPELGLPDLNLNDHSKFYVSGADGAIFGSTVQWRRQTAQSPFVEGQFTVNAVRDVVEDKFAVEVLGTDQVSLQLNLQELVDAFSQSYFNVTMQLDNAVYTYACEPSDYTIDWTRARWHNHQALITFALRRSPVPINGV